jgi:hypothetical protein
MSDLLHIRNYWTKRRDREILEALALKADGFTPEGRTVLEEERKRRKITQEQVEGFRKAHARPEPDLSPEAELVTVARFQHPYQANIAKSFLEDNGISTFVAEEHIISLNWLYSQAVGGAKIQVAKRDVEKAAKILEKGRMGAKGTACGQCGSFDVHRGTRFEKVATWGAVPWIVAPIAVLGDFLFLLLPFFRRTWVCRDCGHRWS